jgi:hypothetical protein
MRKIPMFYSSPVKPGQAPAQKSKPGKAQFKIYMPAGSDLASQMRKAAI